jgi:lipoyl(octanoyl) transferase
LGGVSIRYYLEISIQQLYLNVNVDKTYFKMINPCGITQFGIASIEDYQDNIKISDVKHKLI